MTDERQPERINIDDWPFMVKHPQNINENTRLMLLLHGHLGNEKVMWILTKPVPDNYILLSPRAPIKMGPDQYSWHEIEPQWPSLDTYQELTTKLLSHVSKYLQQNQIQINQYDLMGFSQGAVLSYALAILHPQKVGSVAAVAGFLPQTWKNHLNKEILQDKAFFIAHGSQDDIVPIEKAEKASEWLKEMGARVNFCAAETGHKLSSNCFKGLGEFFKQ
jgi:phospholipase/carboxylesterase